MAQVLQPLTIATHPDIIVGLQTSDDAAVLRISDDMAIVQTVDFFAPVVDDPFEFGMIAAANSMSDIFAMGGTVTMGLNIAGFPEDLDVAILSDIFRGGLEKMQEAGGAIVGGHTVTDTEPKYGIAVTGMIHPDRVWTKAGAQPGDVLFLTKPLGSGVLTTAAKQDKIGREALLPGIQQMTRLNLYARNIAVDHPVHAATDVTGFGLFGHAHEMSTRSGVAMHFDITTLPVLPGAYDLLQNDVAAGGLHRNREHYMSLDGAMNLDDGLVDAEIAIGFDPQTSGGLLFSIPATAAPAFEEQFAASQEQLWRIGAVGQGSGVHVSRSPAALGGNR